jgi:hypothetical protein
MYPRIRFFGKLAYQRIRILPIPIRVSVSVLHSLLAALWFLISFLSELHGAWVNNSIISTKTHLFNFVCKVIYKHPYHIYIQLAVALKVALICLTSDCQYEEQFRRLLPDSNDQIAHVHHIFDRPCSCAPLGASIQISTKLWQYTDGCDGWDLLSELLS